MPALCCYCYQARNQKTEAAWGRNRRSSLTAALKGWKRPSIMATARRAIKQGVDALTEEMLDEAHFLLKKRKVSKLAAITDNALIPSEFTAAEADAAATASHHELELDVRRAHKAKRVRRILGQAPLVTMRKMTCFVEAGIDVARLNAAFRDHRMSLETDRTEADVFIVHCPAQAGQRNTWVAALRGSRIADPEFVLSSGRRGSSIVYTAAVASARFIWISPNVEREHANLAAIVRSACAWNHSKWKLVTTQRDMLATAMKLVRQGRPTALAALLTPADKVAMPALRGFKGARLCHQFITFVSKVDTEASTSGMCGT